jgi:hypothetical protein
VMFGASGHFAVAARELGCDDDPEKRK